MKVYIGWDPREDEAYKVCKFSIIRRTSKPIEVEPLILQDCKDQGLFSREQTTKDGVLWDEISGAPCATEFSISRFLTPHLAKTGWVLFCDCDQMFVDDIMELERYLHPELAVVCTQHKHSPVSETKMDGQIQTKYSRKNWSSFMFFNCDHPSNKKLTVDIVNSMPGRDLHNFCWLDDREIGGLPLNWNHLVGHESDHISYGYKNVHNIHFTEGMPFMDGYEDCEYADVWRNERDIFRCSGMEIK